MVASTHSLDDLGVSHLTSSASHLPHQSGHYHHHHHHHAAYSKSAQDKRSRLSDVINNLRKKVPPPPPPEPASADQPGSSSSVERNLETLEKYVMTVLNGVIDDEAKKDSSSGGSGSQELGANAPASAHQEDAQPEDARGKEPAVVPASRDGDEKLEPFEAHESKLDAAVPAVLELAEKKEPEKRADDEPRETKLEADSSTSGGGQQDEAGSPRTLGAIILERLERAPKKDEPEELRTVCTELINDLLNDILQAVDTPVDKELDSGSAQQSLHCSLPLDKVASVLPNCQQSSETSSSSSSSAKSPTKPSSPTVRHLCLYCDRKFLSISLRQRHTERVHQASGGRRSERNSRKPGQQSCQYCVDRSAENLEGLFQHMVGSHSDKYHGCLQCSTRYLTRDALTSHIQDIHSHVTVQMEKLKEPIPTSVKELVKLSPPPVPVSQPAVKEVKEEPKQPSHEFDSTFYSSVSCNIRENLLHHLDGKIQDSGAAAPSCSAGTAPSPPSQAAASPENSSSCKTPQYQLPIDISLTAVTPVYSKDYPTAPEDYENSSEYAGKPSKSCGRAQPRRVSFEKYNFPRKYDGKEQWSCSIKDLSKFDISTQLTLRKKQRFIKERTTLNRLEELTVTPLPEDDKPSVDETPDLVQSETANAAGGESDAVVKKEECATDAEATVFSSEFESFMRLNKWCAGSNDRKKNAEVVYAELTGEWSRPRVYICGACAERYTTLKELEEHKSASHPNVWCMHFEFSGDQRELYKHLVFLPGRSSSPTPSMKTRQQTIAANQSPEKVCTKCTKSCVSLGELHRHMLECGGDQAWLLGLFGNGKKKCKWRPFGSRSRRRRQRGMKRNIQNSQTPRNAAPRERPPPSGPRVRPSDRESIQKMLANLPAKRATRKVLQENAARSQGRLRNIQSRQIQNKQVLRNKLLKNAKSFHRKKNLREEKQQEDNATADADEVAEAAAAVQPRKQHLRNARVLGKKKNIKAAELPRRTIKLRSAIAEQSEEEEPKKRAAKAAPEEEVKPRKKKQQESLNASLKARSQLRTNDGKFARKNLVSLDAKSRRSINDPVRLLTRSKLRAAAKLAWKEHTKISRRITRLRSLDAVEKSVDEEDMEPEAVKPAKVTSRTASIEEKPVEQLPVYCGRGRRPKKLVEATRLAAEAAAANDTETSSELKTRRSSIVAAQQKTRRSTASLDVSSDLLKKSSKASPAPTPSPEDKLGSTTRSNSRAKRDVKEKSEPAAESANKKTAKEVSDKKTPKRADKKASPTSERSDDLELLMEAPSSVKKEKVGVVRKSPRNKDSDVKESAEEMATKLEDKVEESSPTEPVKDSEKEDVAVTATLEPKETDDKVEKEEEDKDKGDASESAVKKAVPGKRRGRVKRVVENVEEQPKAPETTVAVEETVKAEEDEPPKDTSETEEPNPTPAEISAGDDSCSKSSSSSNLQNLSLEHLQQESSNSNMDSGKENSSETIINMSKLKVVRPKKSRGLRRDNKAMSTKRSLNSVIGILTEGVNVPVESSQDATVVLTVQMTVDADVNSNPENACQNSEQPSVQSSCSSVEESNNTSAEVCDTSASDSASAPVSVELEKTSEEKVKEVPEETKTEKQDVPKVSEESEKITATPIPEKKDDIEVKPSVAVAVVEQPANDIILDLSRRKPKGKGSFLEKIVSKIAKKKDVSLEGESSCHLDIAHVSVECQKNSENVEKKKIQEANSTKVTEEIKIESLLNRGTSVKLSKSATVNIVNNTESTVLPENNVVVDSALPKEDKVEDSNVTEQTLVKPVEIQEEVNKPESKVEEKSNELLNGAIENMESDKSVESESKVAVVEEKELEAKPGRKQKSKKRSFESNSPKKNKKKSVESENADDDDDDDNKEEICLADIMKLIDRPKSSEAQSDARAEVVQGSVKPGKRKTPDDEAELNSVSTSIEDSAASIECTKDNELTKKSRRKSGQKKNKSEIYKLADESRADKEVNDKDDSNVILEKENIEIKVTSDSNEVVMEQISAITLGPMAEVEKTKIDESIKPYIEVEKDEPLVAKPISEVETPEQTEENMGTDNVTEQISVSDDTGVREKPTRRKNKGSKKNSIIEKPELTEKSSVAADDESFKIPESTEIAKPSKKRSSKRKSNAKTISNNQDLEKDEDEATDKLDDKSDLSNDNFDQYSSMSESEDRSTPKRISRRSTRSNKTLEIEDAFGSVKESDDSDVSSVNEMDSSRPRRSQRKAAMADSSRDVSVSSVDENNSSLESKLEKKRNSSRKAKKNVSLVDEHLELFSDNEVFAEPESQEIEKTVIEEIVENNAEKSLDEVEKQPSVENGTAENIEVEEESAVMQNDEEKVEETLDANKKDDAAETLPMPITDKVENAELQLSSVDEILDLADKQLSMNQEVSALELDESGNPDIQTPKKRLAGNFAIVTKSGKILIVEKKKKLTKEAAKFFCDVCATSFTRKSSLKKHNLSQSHILQLTMSSDKDVSKQIQDFSGQPVNLSKDVDEKIVEEEKENENRVIEKQQVYNRDLEQTSPENLVIKDRKPAIEKEIVEEPMNMSIGKTTPIIMDTIPANVLHIREPPLRSPEEELEDEMLDEEICKITENMSHDEYVLTDHVSPVTPEAASTPVKEVETPAKVPAPIIKAAPKKKKEKKKNLADEHLDLDTPVPTKVSLAVAETPSDASVQNDPIEDKNFEEDSILNKSEDETINESLNSISEAEVESEPVSSKKSSSKKDKKSKKNQAKKDEENESKRTNRSKNQNISQDVNPNVLESSRPKRNQLRPSYKEDDFDIIEPLNDRRESSRPKRDRSNVSLVESDQSDFENDESLRKSKDTSKTRRDKSNASVTETETSDAEKDVSMKKGKGKKNQNKKKSAKLTKEQNSEKLVDKAAEGVVDQNSELSAEKLNTELVETDESIVKEKVDEEQGNVSVKTKKGKKTKTTPVENESASIQEYEAKMEEEKPIVEEIPITNQKQAKSKKNQNKRKKKNAQKDESILESSKDELNQANFSETSSAKQVGEQSHDKNSKPSILLEPSLEASENTLTSQTEITIPSLPIRSSRSHPESASKDSDSKQSSIFPHLGGENYKSFEDSKNDLTASMLTGFDSDENSLDTNMSVDIQKLLNDPEMTTEISKQPDEDSQGTDNIEPVDVLNIKKPETQESSTPSLVTAEEETTETEAKEDVKKTPINKAVSKRSQKASKSAEGKKSKKRSGRKSRNDSNKVANDVSSLSEDSDNEEEKEDDSKLQKSKNKIVKSVFGRVFGGEKIDKVKEVLDDWQSRSENNSSDDSESEKSTRHSRSRSRKSLRNGGSIKKSAEASRRSRQSKKRAEELISRAFNDDSPVQGGKSQRSSRRSQAKSMSPSNDKSESDDEDDEQEDEKIEKRAVSSSRRGKKRTNAKNLDSSIVESKQAKYQSNAEDDDGEVVNKSQESQVSQSTTGHEKVQSCEVENTNTNTNEEDEDDELNSRMSPVYARDTSEDEDNTLRSSSSSEHDVEEPREESRKSRKKKKISRRVSSGFTSSEKVVIRSPQALARHETDADGPTEMVTIAPTDAIEDNALDLEMSILEKIPENPARQTTKVLNFDEELFVECCSRLKATSEKEFRGAKKIKLDHSGDQAATGAYHHQHHHRKDEQIGGNKPTKDRWRDVESQNSLGSLLESVNQLLGEDYNSREKEYASTSPTKRSRGHHHHHHHHHHHGHNRHHHSHHHNVERSVSPEDSQVQRAAVEDNLGYDDSLDVAFEHNNKLRDKIQQRMRESENLIATSFGQKHSSPAPAAEAYDGYGYESKTKMNNGLGGLLDKALSNLLHHNEKHDHNGSAPMKLLAELACARAPTSTTPTVPEKPPKSSPTHKELDISTEILEPAYESHRELKSPKKSKNPIKELFERKKELYDKKQQLEKLKLSSPKSSEKSRKQKKVKVVQHNIPIIRTSQYRGGIAERKKRRDIGGLLSKKKDHQSKEIKDIYDFDDEESVSDPGFTSVLSYRSKIDEPSRESTMNALLSKTIGETLMNGKSIAAMGDNLKNMVDRKFRDIEKFATKAKTPVNTVVCEEKQQQPNVRGPMDEFVERRQKSKRSSGEHSSSKHAGKSKKKSGKGAKKKSRNAWYEDDSSDEFVTKLKADDIQGVGISKSQRTCSKGKQNLFAEMSSTSSESEFERDLGDEDDFEPKLVVAEPPNNDVIDEQEGTKEKENLANDESQNVESHENVWRRSRAKSDSPLHDHKKSESEELSDHPLVIDENHKEPADIEQRTNSDDETEERTFELDDLYREDSSIADSDRDELSIAADKSNSLQDKSNSLFKAPETTSQSSQDNKSSTEKYISIEDALDLLDRPLEETSKKGRSSSSTITAVKQFKPDVFQKDKRMQEIDDSQDDDEATPAVATKLDELPEKLSGNEKPQRQPENLPLHVFLSRKVQESKKRKQQQELKKLIEEQERIMLDLQPTRRQRKCAIGKQGLLAEISSSDEELSIPYNRKSGDKSDNSEKMRNKQKQRESKEKRKERYIEKKHEQMIAKEQKAIEEEIMRELEEKRLSAASEASGSEKDEKKPTPEEISAETREKTFMPKHKASPKKHSHKQKNREILDESDSGNTNKIKRPKFTMKATTDTENDEVNTSIEAAPPKKKRPANKSPQKAKKSQQKAESKTPSESKKSKQLPSNASRSKSRPTSLNRGKETKEQQSRSLSNKRESDLDSDEELKATKSWNKVDEGVGIAIGRRKRAAANQLYYWSSSSDDEDEEKQLAAAMAASAAASAQGTAANNVPVTTATLDGQQEDDRQEQHGWIVGDSHKKMITMLAMEKQMKEKRRRSENDEQSPGGGTSAPAGGKGKSKKHRNSTS